MGNFDNNRLTTGQCRRFYAEEIRVVAGVTSRYLVEAYARVPREHFLGAPPWRFAAGVSLRQPSYRTTNDVRDLYHDVVVALKVEQYLNNAQPSVMARLIDCLDLAPGARVMHVGCGTGYYSAILSEIVGPMGFVTAVEVDAKLAALAKTNLGEYTNTAVVNQDAASITPGPMDAILVNTGVTHLCPAWLGSLTASGVLVAPFLVGKADSSRVAIVLRIAKQGARYAAELVSTIAIYPSSSLTDSTIQSQLSASMASRSMLRLQSLRVDEHSQIDSCIVHTREMCLSAEAVH